MPAFLGFLPSLGGALFSAPLVEKAGEASRQEAAQARLLGTDPQTGKPIYARFGRFGPMLQRGDAEDGGPGTDFHAVMQGYVSITPLQLDRTFSDAFSSLDGWLEGLR